MASELNFFDTYVLMAITEEIVPQQTFFKDRYFPTGEGDIFACDKVLTEYRKGDRKMAAFVSARAGDIPMDRRGYEIHEYQPAFIAPSRLLTLDELRQMDAPVWCLCKPIEGGNGFWCLCKKGKIITPSGVCYDVKEIPHWVFLRNKPKE